MVDLIMPPPESSPLIEALLILITTGFAVTAVVFTTTSILNALIPLICTILFFTMFMAHKGVIGGQ